jgi:hypothetical protein
MTAPSWRRLAAAYGVRDADRDRKLTLIAGHASGVRAVLMATWTHAAVLNLAADHTQECATDACRTCIGIANMLAMQLAYLAAYDSDDFQTIIHNLENELIREQTHRDPGKDTTPIPEP